MTTTTEDYRASKTNHVLFRAVGWLAAPECETLESTHELVTLLVAQLKAHGIETCDGLPASQEPKYTVSQGRLVNRSTGKPIPDDEPVFILRAKDRVAVYAIMAYRAQCTGNPEHHDAVDARVGDFLRFKEMHPQRMKSPDTAALKASRSPGDLSPEEFQEAWRKANELKANEQRPLVYPDMWPCKYPRMAGSIAQDCEYPNCDCGPEEGKASDGRCPDCGVGAEFDGVWHKPGCPQL